LSSIPIQKGLVVGGYVVYKKKETNFIFILLLDFILKLINIKLSNRYINCISRTETADVGLEYLKINNEC